MWTLSRHLLSFLLLSHTFLWMTNVASSFSPRFFNTNPHLEKKHSRPREHGQHCHSSRCTRHCPLYWYATARLSHSAIAPLSFRVLVQVWCVPGDRWRAECHAYSSQTLTHPGNRLSVARFLKVTITVTLPIKGRLITDGISPREPQVREG